MSLGCQGALLKSTTKVGSNWNYPKWWFSKALWPKSFQEWGCSSEPWVGFFRHGNFTTGRYNQSGGSIHRIVRDETLGALQQQTLDAIYNQWYDGWTDWRYQWKMFALSSHSSIRRIISSNSEQGLFTIGDSRRYESNPNANTKCRAFVQSSRSVCWSRVSRPWLR